MRHDANPVDSKNALLTSAAMMSYDLPDEDLAVGLLDLARTARKEIHSVGLTTGDVLPVDSNEGMLLYRIIPELSRRLLERNGVSMMSLREERIGGDVRPLSDQKLRFACGSFYRDASFPIIAEKVRDRFDPHFEVEGRFFATEALAHPLLFGNILQIAVTRLAPAASDSDPFVRIMAEQSMKLGIDPYLADWSPAIHNEILSHRAVDSLQDDFVALPNDSYEPAL